jgi:tetratricopeptide (TPR) repeat protein/transcriptional regulator with XRE-family HTH domain
MGSTNAASSIPVGDSFGALLRHYRLAAGLTQEALAAAAALSVRGISDLERGVNRAPRLDTLRLLAEALRLAPQERTQFMAHTPQSDEVRTRQVPVSAAVPPLIGRDRELAALRIFLAGEEPSVLLFAGPPGIGKSRLLQEAHDQAEAAGWRVLAAGGRRRGGQEPFAPIAEALERQLVALPPPRVRAALEGCAWLVRLLPELADGPIEPLPSWQVSPEHERRLMFRAVARFLANVAGPTGTLLVLDDLQWAGADALDLLAALTQPQAAGLAATLAAPLRVLGAYRDTEVGPRDPFALLQADLARAGLVTHRTLRPLAGAEAERLLRALLSEGTGTGTMMSPVRIAQCAGGVPFFLVSWARHLRERSPAGDGGEELPWDLRQSIRQQVAALSEGAQAILALAAVAGREAPGALLLAAAEQPDAALTSLEEVCRAQLLQEVGGDSYRFAHDVLHEVAESGMNATRRALLHRRLGTALESQPGEPRVEALAYHFRRGGDQEKAANYLERAGDRAATRHADAAAEASYADLVDLLDGLGRDRAAAGAREKLAAVLTRRSRYSEALAVLDRAAQVYREETAWLDLARVAARLGALHAEMGTTAEGMMLVQPLVARLEPLGPSPELLDLYLTINDLGMHAGESESRLAATERAVAMARDLGNDLLLAEACGALGSLLGCQGHSQKALTLLQEGQRHLEVAGTPVSLGAIRLLNSLAGAQLYEGQQAAGLLTFDAAVQMTERFGDPRYLAWLVGERGNAQIFAGNWDGAARDLERAVALHRQIGISHGSACIIGMLGRLRLLQGMTDDAVRLFEEAKVLSEHSGNVSWAWDNAWCLADLLRRRGYLREARDRFLDLGAWAGYFLFEPAAVGLARAHLDLGDVDRAAQTLSDLMALPAWSGNPFLRLEVLATHVLVATRQGRWVEAARCLEEGFALAQTVAYPYGESQLLHASGLLLVEQGRPDAARAQLEAALAIVIGLGARLDMAAIVADLAALPVPTPTV